MAKPIALAADHGGFELKEAVKVHLEELGLEYIDYGTHRLPGKHHAVCQKKICVHSFPRFNHYRVCFASCFILRLPRCTRGSLPSLQMGHSSGA